MPLCILKSGTSLKHFATTNFWFCKH